MLIAAIDVVRARSDSFFKATKAVPESVVSAISVKGLIASKKFIGTHFASINYVNFAVLPRHFAVAPEAFRIVKRDGAFYVAHVARSQRSNEHKKTQLECVFIHWNPNGTEGAKGEEMHGARG